MNKILIDEIEKKNNLKKKGRKPKSTKLIYQTYISYHEIGIPYKK
jgi:Cys-tRNA synthase (O-phospho-L-seryl-tRNA:Cys-tRNA synthase)